MKYLTTVFLILCTMANAGQYNSQASQDQFVNTMLYDLSGKDDQGYYLEIGAADPVYLNNTHFFEKNKSWNGVSIDISSHFVPMWATARNNPLLVQDALLTDYEGLLSDFPRVIDYLSLDIDGLYDAVLAKLPHDQHIFKVITIEHDAYRFGDIYRDNERAILNELGYQLVCGNVTGNGVPFEDWWVHPSAFSEEVLQNLISLDMHDLDNQEVVQTIRAHFSL